MKVIFGLLTITFLCSCTSLLGIRDPVVLKRSEIKRSAEGLGLNPYQLYYMDSVVVKKLSSLPYKPGWNEGFRPLQFKVFNPEGKLIAQFSTCEGNYRHFPGLLKFPPENNINPHNPEWTIQKEMNYLLPVETVSYNGGNDLTLVVYWATWLGRPGKKMVSRVKDYRKMHSDKSIGIILVNLLEWPGE